MLPPYAKLLVRKNGGAPQSGPLTCAAGDSIQLSVEQPSTIESYRWEIYGYPPGWTAAGWTLDSGSGALVSAAPSPPAFTLTGWGKWMLRLVINGGVTRDIKNSPAIDETTALEIVSPKGLRDLPPGEHTQFGGPASWARDHQRNLRVIEAGLGGGGPGGDVTLSGDVTGPSGSNTVEAIRGVPVSPAPGTPTQVLTRDASGCGWADPAIPTAAQVPFDPAGTGMAATKVQAAIVEAFNKPPSSDATKIQGVSVSTAALLAGQSHVRNEAGILVPRFTSPSSDRLITAPGTTLAALGENLYVDVSAGDVDVKLPASPVIGATVRIKRLSTNASLVTVDGNGSTIDGDTAITIKPQEAALFRCYAAGKWARLGKCEAVAQGSVRHLGLEYDPIALWKLDGSFADYSGNGHSLTAPSPSVHGYVTPTAGFTCLYTADQGAYRIGTGWLDLSSIADVTVQALLMVGSSQLSGGATIVAVTNNNNSQPHFYKLRITDTSTIWSWRNEANTAEIVITGPAIPQGMWVHLAATRRIVGGTAVGRIYLNGTKIAESEVGLPYLSATGAGVYILGSTNANLVAFRGMGASVKINSRALTDAEVYAEAQRAGLAP